MKYDMHKIILTIATLMVASANAWAGNVVITTTPANSGTVEASEAEAGQTCTLTVTPAEGYFLKTITAIATLRGEAMQAPQRRIPIAAHSTIAITASNTDADPYGVTTHTFTMPEDFDVEVTAEFGFRSYGITVSGTAVTSVNRTNVLGDDNFSVKFDGNNMLMLNNATIDGLITVDASAQLAGNMLVVFLQGTNAIGSSNSNGGIKNENATMPISLTFDTNASNPGTLTISPTESAFDGLAQVAYKNNLEGLHDGTTFIVKTILPPVVTESGQEAETNFADEMTASTNTNNNVVDGLLYTTGDDSGDNAGTVSGYDDQSGKFVFTDDAVMTQGAVNAATATPGTADYAEQFTGITGKLPAGRHEIILSRVELADGYDFFLQVGSQDAISLRNHINRLFGAVSENVMLQLLSAGPDYLRFYLARCATGAPQMAGHRIGPKSSVAGGLGGIKIKSNEIVPSPTPADTYKRAEKSEVTSQMDLLTAAPGDGFTFSNPTITDLPDDMFVSGSTAPRRAGTISGTVLPEGLTFVDFTATSITGMEVSRTSGAFNKVPDNVFIYMPAGNTVAKGTKNVVIGSLCSEMELDGSTSAQPFKASKDFTAGQATLKRSFDENVIATVYLPYSVAKADADALGEFMTVTSVSEASVELSSKADGLDANTPYVLKPSSTASEFVARVAMVSTAISSQDKLIGVYENTPYTVGDWYCYAAEDRDAVKSGEFVRMVTGAYVPAFRAYIQGTGTGANSLTIDWNGNLTGIDEAITSMTRMQNGWFTLSGMRLNGQPAKPGIYIHNGRKAVVK